MANFGIFLAYLECGPTRVAFGGDMKRRPYMSSRFFKLSLAAFMVLAISSICACGDESMMSDDELSQFGDEMEWRMDDVDLKPLDDSDLTSCEPGWDGC